MPRGERRPECLYWPAPWRHAAASGASSDGKSASVASESYVWKNVTVLGGGFVTGVIFSPLERDLVYVRTDVGGAYRYEPKDKVWTAITDSFGRADSNFPGIESIAADPVDASRVYMAVGTYPASRAGQDGRLPVREHGRWRELNDAQHQFGGGNVITGDPRVFGRAYLGTGGRDVLYSQPR